MMRSDMHHRTEDFRKVYRACLADLKEVLGTSNDVVMFAASGTGAMDASVSNLFSKGDKVIVCVAGKFGERWADIAKAYGLDAHVITMPYGQVVTPEQLDTGHGDHPGVGRSAALRQANRHGGPGEERPIARRSDPCGGHQARTGTVLRWLAGFFRDGDQSARGDGFGRDREGIPQPLRVD